jgi:hypothetical protein
VSLGVASAISPASTTSEQISLEPVLSPEDTALVAEMEAKIPELFIKSLAGSHQEDTIRCIMDIAATYLDRLVGMHDIARGQGRSLSEDPRRRRQLDMPSATSAPKSVRPLETIYEDELGDAVPIGHALFIPMDDALPNAPYPIAGQSGLPEAITRRSASLRTTGS